VAKAWSALGRQASSHTLWLREFGANEPLDSSHVERQNTVM